MCASVSVCQLASVCVGLGLVVNHGQCNEFDFDVDLPVCEMCPTVACGAVFNFHRVSHPGWVTSLIECCLAGNRGGLGGVLANLQRSK